MTGPANHDYEPPSLKFHRSGSHIPSLESCPVGATRPARDGLRRSPWRRFRHGQEDKHFALLLSLGCRHHGQIAGLDQKRGPGPVRTPTLRVRSGGFTARPTS
jgi:hypothetical protein